MHFKQLNSVGGLTLDLCFQSMGQSFGIKGPAASAIIWIQSIIIIPTFVISIGTFLTEADLFDLKKASIYFPCNLYQPWLKIGGFKFNCKVIVHF